MKRPPVEEYDIDKTIDEIKNRLYVRLGQKGDGILASSHEVLSVISEEFDEYKWSVHDNDATAQHEELMDIAVAAVMGMASMKSGKMDWL